jgi:anti-sigma factor RsiW
MNCNEARQNLEPALDGALDEAALRPVQAHVTTCAQCRAQLERLEGVRALLRETLPTSPSESLDARIMRSFHKHHADRPSWRASATRLRDLFLGSLRVPVPILAMILIAVVGMVLLAYRTGKQNAQHIVVNPVPPGAEHVAADVAPGEIKKTSPVDQTVPVPASPAIVQGSRIRYRRNRVRAVIKNGVGEQSIKSSTVITSNNATYSTLAGLKGFEPLPIARARIIKGEQR